MTKKLPIQQLIEDQCSRLNINHKELIAKTGYRNISVGLRRLQCLYEGDFNLSRGLVEQLPNVLELNKAVLEQAIVETKLQIKRDADLQYRANFKPNFIIRTAKNGRPKQITIAAFINASKYISGKFPDDLEGHDYINYALAHYENFKKQITTFYFATENIVINYSPETAVVFTLTGEAISNLDRSIQPGILSYHLR